MNPNFDIAVQHVLKHEGGFVHHPADPGGATNMGVSLRFLENDGLYFDNDGDGDMDADDIALMTEEQAIEVYLEKFWKKEYENLHEPAVAIKLFDMAVNMGHKQATKIFQRACNDCGPIVDVDGYIGQQTIHAANCSSPECLLREMVKHQKRFYEKLIEKKPSLAAFAHGWNNRADFKPQIIL